MSIPDFQSVMLPLLQAVADGAEHSMRELVDSLSERFGLTEEERQQMLPSGQMKVIANRVHWAKKHLKEAGLLEQIRRGVIRITVDGNRVVAEHPSRVDLRYLRRFPAYVSWRRGTGDQLDADQAEAVPLMTQTPEERIDASYLELREALSEEVLQQVKDASDTFFERLVVELLVAMGYGGSIEDAGKAVGKSGDGGIDGVIKEDKLGLDVVVIQAKKWKDSPVGRPTVQSFAGRMETYRANKGVFITTSSFSEPAAEYVRQIQRKIVLIDGPTLAGLLIDHDIGVARYRSYVLKRLDSDYFEQ